MTESAENSKRPEEEMGSGLAPNGDIKPWWKSWQKKREFDMELEEDLLRKNFDMPKPTPMRDVNSNNNTGIGARGLIGVALAAAIPGLGGAYMAYQAMNKEPTVIEKRVAGPPGKTVPGTNTDLKLKTPIIRE